MPLCGFHWHFRCGTFYLELFYNCFKEVLAFVHREFLWQVEVNGYFFLVIACTWTALRILSNMWTFQALLCERSVWIFQLNLICSLRETLWFSRFHRFCSFLRGATVNGVNQFWMLWMPCSYVCVNGLSLAVQESHRSPHAKEVPHVEGSSWCLWPSPCECEWLFSVL